MKVFGVIVLGMVALLVLRFAVQGSYRTVVTSITSDEAAECLSLTGSTTGMGTGYADIIGTIRNNCNHKFTQVTVSFKLDPSSSGFTPAVQAYVSDVQPGETRKFKSSTHIPNNAIFRFDSISGF